VGLKVDENKLPADITSFKCPKCKHPVPVSLLSQKEGEETSSDTVLIRSVKSNTGQITVLFDNETPQQVFRLCEGVSIIGRQSSKPSRATISIQTADKTMSREHIRVEVKKDGKGGYKHYLSDNNSKNHTLYNSNNLEDGEQVVLNDNDEIIIGHTVLRFNE
jgi:pSer/pThr/pTyr-binding forkhead associated (FHA) protein